MKTFKRILNILSTVIVIAAVAAAILLAGVRVVGITPYVVTSGSMEPELHVGSAVYVKKVDPKDLKPGDIITFHIADDLLATHRIVEVLNENGHLSFRTKGDANELTDSSPVDENDVEGKVLFNIPYLGGLKSYTDSGTGRIVGICGALILLILVTLSEYLVREDK